MTMTKLAPRARSAGAMESMIGTWSTNERSATFAAIVVDGQNVVLYYALHLHHIPRTEDWPGMPVDWHGFMLRPRDFLDSSPVQPK